MALVPPYYVPAEYRSRVERAYFNDVELLADPTVWQPEVYTLAAKLVRCLNNGTIIDVGCGSAKKLMDLNYPRTLGIDFGSNINFCKTKYPQAKWLELDLESPDLKKLESFDVSQSVVICADVIEHLVDPIPLTKILRNWSTLAPAVLISTPDRNLVRMPGDMGPPANPHHVREWTIKEFEMFLIANDVYLHSVRHTLETNISDRRATILAIGSQFGSTQKFNEVFQPAMREFPALFD